MKDQSRSSLHKCNKKRSRYLEELNDLSKRLDTTGDARVLGELEAK